MGSRVVGTVDRIVREYPNTRLSRHAAIAAETLDDWVVASIQGYAPTLHPALVMDIGNTEAKAFALFDRVMSRRNELLQLQGQAYLRLLQYDFSFKSRALSSVIAQSSTRVEETDISKRANAAAAVAFGRGESPLDAGFAAQSSGLAESDSKANEKETDRRNALQSQARLQAEHEDSVHALHELERGPFDYLGRYERLKKLYLNDYKSFIDAVHHYLESARFYGIQPRFALSYRSPEFVWQAGEAMQVLSRAVFAARVSRFVRHLSLSIGWWEWDEASRCDLPFTKDPDGNGIAADLPLRDFVARMSGTLATPAPGWAKLKFAVPQDQRFNAQWGNAISMADARIETLGIQWIVVTPRFDENSAGSAFEQNRATEYRMRNKREITVPTIISPPAQSGDVVPAFAAHFPTASTTDEPTDSVAALNDPLLAGRPLFGVWSVDVGMPHRKGKAVPRLHSSVMGMPSGIKPTDDLAYPSLCGLQLFLTVSAARS
jgi:hypothetical protein